MVSPLILANNILQRAFCDPIYSVTPMKLQKLLYFVYKEYYQRYRQRLFSEEFLAWKYGPVLQSVYYEFKHFGASPITKFGKDANGDVLVVDEYKSPQIKEALDIVWTKYKCFSGINLSTLTHQQDTAWDKAIKAHRLTLDDEDIYAERL